MRFPIFAVISLIIFVVACDFYIYLDIKKYVNAARKKVALIFYAVSTILCWALVITALAMPKKADNVSLLPTMWMLYVALSIYVPKFIYCVCSLVGRLIKPKARRNYGIWVGCVFGLLVCGMMWWGACVTRYQIVTNHVVIESSKLPKSFDGFKVLQFSDTHVGTWGNDTTFISKMVDSINANKADVILFTGDYVNARSEEYEPFAKILSRLKAPYGVYGVFGNHDYSSYVDWPSEQAYLNDLSNLRTMVDSVSRIHMINNKTEFLKKGNDSIVLIGVDNWGEPPFKQLGDLGKSYPDSPDKLHGLNDGMFKILMTHNPEHWNQVATKISNIDLTMSGHTHAMQIMFKIGDWKWSPSKYRYKNWAGLYTEKAKDGNPMNLYVNIGVGEVGFPARIGAAKPELTVFTLKSK